jgi:hypothetical protein
MHPSSLERAAHYCACAAASLANAEAAVDEKTCEAHMAIAKHYYSLADEEIRQLEAWCQPAK